MTPVLILLSIIVLIVALFTVGRYVVIFMLVIAGIGYFMMNNLQLATSIKQFFSTLIH